MIDTPCTSETERKRRRQKLWWSLALFGVGAAIFIIGSKVDPIYAPLLKGAGRGIMISIGFSAIVIAYPKPGAAL